MEKTTLAAQEAAELVAQIARATQEQGQGIEQVNATVAQLDTVTQSNASLVQEVSALTEGLLQQSRELVAAAGRFRLDENADEPRLAPTMALAVG
jgi:methyl-accepting chemotaxis protein